MKTIGLIGGISWESTAEYYRIINQETQKRLGGYHSAKLALVSLDFAEVEVFQSQGRWEEAGQLMVRAAVQLEAAGAELILICANTMHKLAGQVQDAVAVPLLHIVEVTAQAIKAQGLDRVGLLGTRFTMTEDFVKGGLQAKGLEVLTPDAEGMKTVDGIIYKELVKGQIKDSSRRKAAAVVGRLAGLGAQGVILGCTELPLLLKPGDAPLPLFDTTLIHAQAAVEAALS